FYVKLRVEGQESFFFSFKSVGNVENDIRLEWTVLHKMKHMRGAPAILWISFIIKSFNFSKSAKKDSIQCQPGSVAMIGMSICRRAYETNMWTVSTDFLNNLLLKFAIAFEACI